MTLNNLQCWYSIKTQPTNQLTNIYLIYMYKQDLALNNQKGWYAIKHNPPTHF